jgi:hypothetical protein
MAPRNTSITASLALAAALLAAAGAGRAQEATPTLAGGAVLGDAEVTARLDGITAALDDGKALANLWWFGWIAIQGGSAAGFGALAIADPKSPDMPVNAVTAGASALGLTMLLAIPFVPAYAPRALRKLPADTPDARRAKLAAAEDWLRRSAETEALGRSWLTHLLNFGSAALAGVLLAFAFETTDWRDGLYNFGLLFAVAEIQVVTQPTRAERSWKEYRRRYALSAPSADGVEVSLVASPIAAAISVRF